MSREKILNEVSIEREKQEIRFGHVNKEMSIWQLMNVFAEEAGESHHALNDAYDWETKAFNAFGIRELRKELVQTAAMAIQIIEWIDARFYQPKATEKERQENAT